MVKSIFRENREKLALKRSAHFLIDRIKWKGYSKDDVYGMLSKELGVDEAHSHFSSMNTLRELRPAVEALVRIEKRIPKTGYALGRRGPRRKKSKPDLRPDVVAVRDQIPPKTILPPKEKRTKTLRKDYGRNTLSRPEVLKALDEMKQERLSRDGIQFYPDDMKIDVNNLPAADDRTWYVVAANYDELYGRRKNWLYNLLKKLWPKRKDQTQ